jgi:hypothetical protein
VVGTKFIADLFSAYFDGVLRYRDELYSLSRNH